MNDRCPCGNIILADTEEWKTPLCIECYFLVGEPIGDPEIEQFDEREI